MPTINNLSDASYTELANAIVLDGDISFSGGTNYRAGYLELEISDAAASETLSFVTDGSPSATSGEVSIVGEQVYLGNGAQAVLVGAVDPVFNGQNGQKLRVNFVSEFQNGNFEAGSPGDTTIPGWTVVNEQVKFGTDTIAGLLTPTDTTIQPQAPNSDQNTASTVKTITTDLSANTNDGSSNSVRLESDLITESGYDIVRGPYIYSNNTVTLEADDTVSFEWQAKGGEDDYDVYGYIVDVNTNRIETILDDTGSTTSWTKETIAVSQAGEYRFVFVAGTYDLTGGTWAGAQLFIDNVEVDIATPLAVNDSHLSAIAQKVQYSNSSKTPDPTRTLTVSTQNTAQESDSDSAVLNIIQINNAPIFTQGADETITEDAGAQSIAAWATDISPGAADEASQTVSFSVSSDNDSLFTVQPSIDSAGNLTYTPAPNANGSATVTVSLSDDGGTANGAVDTSEEQTFTITVEPDNDAPTVGEAIANQSAIKDTNFSFSVPSGSFNDIDEEDSFTYSATLSDGSDLPSWLMFAPATQTFSGNPPSESDVETLEIKVTATDSSEASISSSFQLDIADSKPKLINGDQANDLEIEVLGSAQSMRLSFEDFGLEGVGELLIFNMEEDGSKTQIASFFSLDGKKLSSDYSTEFSISSEQLFAGEQLQFELVENGSVRTGSLSLKDDSTAVLDFGDNTQLAVALRSESATPSLLRNDATTLDLTGYDGGDVTLNFSVFREASFDSTVGFYRTDDANGGITDPMTGDTLQPGDEGYKEAALSRQLDVQLSTQNGEVSTFSSTMTGGSFLGMYLISDGSDAATGELLFSGLGMNGGNDHVKALGDNTFGFEDMAGLGDRDFNDIVVKVEVA